MTFELVSDIYGEFAQQFGFCFACRFQPLPSEFTFGLAGRLEIAHIIGGAGRCHDRRAIVRLCKSHHMLEHGERLRHEGNELPRLTLGNMCWLKKQFDGEFWDAEFISECRKRKNGRIDLPELLAVEPIG